MFRVVSASLGFDPTVLFMISFSLIAVLLSQLKVPRMTYPVSFLMYSFFGVSFGLIPIWIPIAGFIFTALFVGGEFAKMLGGNLPGESSPIVWSKPIAKLQPEIKVTENCKNCGGPNVDRVTCVYCGLVLE